MVDTCIREVILIEEPSLILVTESEDLYMYMQQRFQIIRSCGVVKRLGKDMAKRGGNWTGEIESPKKRPNKGNKTAQIQVW